MLLFFCCVETCNYHPPGDCKSGESCVEYKKQDANTRIEIGKEIHEFIDNDGGKEEIYKENRDIHRKNEDIIDESQKDNKVDNTPKITNIYPSNCCTEYTLNMIIKGVNIDEGTKIIFNDKTIKTYFDGPTQVSGRVTFPATVGKYKVWLENSDGKRSDYKMFDVVPCRGTKIAYLQPRELKSNENSQLKIIGQGFLPSHKIYFEDKELGTKYIDTRELNVNPYLSLKGVGVGEYKIRVKTDKEICGSYFTGSRTLTVISNSTNPEIYRVFPNAMSVGSKYSVTIEGKNFNDKCKVYLNNKLFNCNFVSSYQVKFEFDVDNSWKKGEYDLYLENSNLEKSNSIKVQVK